MHPAHTKTVVMAIAAALTIGLYVGLEAVDVRVENSKTFDFKGVRTWAWNPDGAGDVRMARTQTDDPDAMKRRAEPWIRDAAETELMRRGLQQVSTGPDLTLTYFLLLSTTMSAQTMGQFLPATAGWGLPPFAEATQSLKMMNQGSLVLDFSANHVVVWRGVAQAQIKPGTDDSKREAVLREGVRDLVKRYPPK